MLDRDKGRGLRLQGGGSWTVGLWFGSEREDSVFGEDSTPRRD